MGEKGESMSKIITIYPSDELILNAESHHGVLSLTNQRNKPVAFKVKVSTLEKYRVRPSSGVIPSGDSCEVIVSLTDQSYQPLSPDKFLLIATEAEHNVMSSNEISELWKRTPKEALYEHKISCLLASAKSKHAEIPPTVFGLESKNNNGLSNSTFFSSNAVKAMQDTFQQEMAQLQKSVDVVHNIIESVSDRVERSERRLNYIHYGQLFMIVVLLLVVGGIILMAATGYMPIYITAYIAGKSRGTGEIPLHSEDL